MKKKALSFALALMMCLGLTIPAFAATPLDQSTAEDIQKNFTIMRNGTLDENQGAFLSKETENYYVQCGDGEEYDWRNQVNYAVIDENDSWTITNTGKKDFMVSGNTDYEICIYIRDYWIDTKILGKDKVFSREESVSNYWTDKGTFLYGALEGSDELGHIVSLKAGESTTIPAKAFLDRFGNLLDGYGPIYEMEIASAYKGQITEEYGFEDIRYTTYYFRVNNGETKKIKDGLNTSGDTKPTTPDASAMGGFTDVKSSDYFADAVQWAVERNITSGTSATTFSPGATCSKAQILTFLWRANGSPEPTAANPFTDIKPTDYFYNAALWAAEKGLVSGSAFAANTDCTRAMTVTYLWKAVDSPESSQNAGFADVPADAECAQAVAWAVENGVTSGTGNGQFSPDTTCTRGQIVTFLHRAMEK